MKAHTPEIAHPIFWGGLNIHNVQISKYLLLNIDLAMSNQNRMNRAICGASTCGERVRRGFCNVYCTVMHESAAAAICSACSRDLRVRSVFLWLCLRSA